MDRLNIIAHDRFQEIIDDANRADSPIKLKTLILEAPGGGDDGMQSMTVQPNLAGALGLNQGADAPEPADAATQAAARGLPVATPMFTTTQERQAAHAVMQVLAEYEVRPQDAPTRQPTYTVGAGQPVRDYRHTVDEPSRIKQMVFGHFSRCLYPLQKFDSDTERRFAVILERDADKWFKPAKGQFQVFYKLGVEQPEYVPDFVVETAQYLLMCETKARNELGADEVKAKAEAGALWCKHASDHARTHDAKPWKYLLVPHDQVTEDKRLVDYLSFEVAV